MEVAAHGARLSIATIVRTHFRRGEDPSLKSGKLDEELARMSRIVDDLHPGSLVLLNESFASTGAEDGSAIAAEILRALNDSGIRVVFVTHHYELVRDLLRAPGVVSLRASERRDFILEEAPPLPTSHALDLYRSIMDDI